MSFVNLPCDLLDRSERQFAGIVFDLKGIFMRCIIFNYEIMPNYLLNVDSYQSDT